MTNTIVSIPTGTPQRLRRRRPARRYQPWRTVPSRIRPYVVLAEQRGELLLYGNHGTLALPEEVR